jgi:predicted Zn-dependent peptidase
MSFQKSILPNGVRVLTETVGHVGSVSIGLWAKTGSSDERDSEAGISHLIEHMLFKGTETRTAQQIAKEIEGRGGSFNAFTDKQVTCYYCTLLAQDAEVGVDVLADMALRSKLDASDLAKEKQVVIEEIRRGEDDPESQVFEVHMSNRWGNHQLGRPIIGTRESVASFERQNLKDYMDRRYCGGHLILAAVGNVTHDEILKWAEEKMASALPGSESTELDRPTGAPGSRYDGKEIEQVHFCIGGDGPAIFDEDFYSAQLMNEILGGGMSSRLWHEVRETRGLAYSIGSYYGAYTAGGAMVVYGGTSRSTWDEVQEVVAEELTKLGSEGPDEEELELAKRSLIGSLVISLEGTGSRMRRMARQELLFSRQIPVEETVAKLNAVTAKNVRETAATRLSPSLLTTTAIGPK